VGARVPTPPPGHPVARSPNHRGGLLPLIPGAQAAQEAAVQHGEMGMGIDRDPEPRTEMKELETQPSQPRYERLVTFRAICRDH